MTKNEALNKELFLKICGDVIKRDGIGELLLWLEKTDFFTAPASTKFHGNYDGGLCEHSLLVHKALQNLISAFGVQGITEETIAIAALLHDLCKVNFYKKGFRNVKDEETNQWIKKEIYEIDDQLPLGHGEKSCLLIQRFMKLTVDEVLAIRYHMGGFDAAVKGGDYGMAKAQTMSPLVTLLQAADMISSNLLEETR